MDDAWYRCEWCGWWIYSYNGWVEEEDIDEKYDYVDVDGIGLMCLRCFEEDEPPFHPNNRDRCANYLVQFLADRIEDDSIRVIATYLAANVW